VSTDTTTTGDEQYLRDDRWPLVTDIPPRIQQKVKQIAERRGLVEVKPDLLLDEEYLLARCYRAMSRESWQDGETIEEVRSAVNDFMFNLYGVNWDDRFPRKNGPVEKK
jgi:hypothetical protein